jgi:hypothetical protein
MELSKIGLLLAKAESTYGTDPTPDSTNNVIATTRGEVTLDDMGEQIVRDILDGGFSRVPSWMTKLALGIKFRTELRGNRTTGAVADISAGAIANKVSIDPLLLACDMAATYTAESGVGNRDGCVIYKPTIPSAQGSSVAFYLYTQSKLYKLLGGKGDFSIGLRGGQDGLHRLGF